ncbi:MAG: DUF1549 domain-containing protein, partial [Gemmataceae bacterium]
RLDREGLAPLGPADRAILLRRVSLDLTGLPPTLEESERFLNDPRPDAYERLVDRLLASPSYGERWAVPWLDLARYADSQGYASDPDRTIWPYRDWVLSALNANMPYDRFTVEQLAGDLLPNANSGQVLATGFHRNTLTNTEGGTNPEEFRSAAVVDRVNTTFQVWQATTMACAQCHSHKYDPFSQKEYYSIYAIFNSCEDANGGDDAPRLEMPRPGYEPEHEQLRQRVIRLKGERDNLQKTLDGAFAAWIKGVDVKTLPKPIADVMAIPVEKRSAPQKEQLLAHHRSLSAPWNKLQTDIKTAEDRARELLQSSPVLRERKDPRPTHVHIRGEFESKGEAVKPGLPTALPGPGDGAKIDRLTLARWLVDGRNPLTARVAVNRIWEELFGIGIVETSEDFGTQGD